jgi:hypothetical protein
MTPEALQHQGSDLQQLALWMDLSGECWWICECQVCSTITTTDIINSSSYDSGCKKQQQAT